jgi:hypothetical protein
MKRRNLRGKNKEENLNKKLYVGKQGTEIEQHER